MKSIRNLEAPCAKTKVSAQSTLQKNDSGIMKFENSVRIKSREASGLLMQCYWQV